MALQPTAGRLNDAVIRVYDETGNVIETHEHQGDFKEAKGGRSPIQVGHRGFKIS
jgi:hypothetical protein